MNIINIDKKIKKNDKIKICILGLGYVGLPLAIAFAKKFSVTGYDVDKSRINDLKKGQDKNNEIKFKKLKNFYLTSNPEDLKECNCYIVTLPTPIKFDKTPDLSIIADGTKLISKYLNYGDVVIYESTVYPGCTEEFCVPILEQGSDLKLNKDFHCGYSPERINPGDKYHQIKNIVKIVSGSNKKVSSFIEYLYGSIIDAGTFKASSIKVAEAAKVIENTQRDLNIAFINELSIIFNKLNLNTEEILQAAESKWNFHKYRPGLVGGHCIGIDPYYLTYKANQVGHIPKIILSGREINNSMSIYVTENLLKKMKQKQIRILNSKILILGLSFKENCSDLRNSKVFEIISNLKKHKCIIEVYDPLIKNYKSKNFKLISRLKTNKYDAIMICIKHDVFKKISNDTLKKCCKKNYVIYDLKYLYKKEESDLRL